jgi:hypothetical protein
LDCKVLKKSVEVYGYRRVVFYFLGEKSFIVLKVEFFFSFHNFFCDPLSILCKKTVNYLKAKLFSKRLTFAREFNHERNGS